MKHIFASGRTSTPSLKTFDSAFESTRCQLYAHVFLRPQLLQNINCSMLKHVKNSQIDSKMTCSMYDSNFSGVVEVVKRHARIADTLFFQTRYRTFSTKQLKFSYRQKCVSHMFSLTNNLSKLAKSCPNEIQTGFAGKNRFLTTPPHRRRTIDQCASAT